MSIYEDTNPRELKELLGQIHNGEAVLPDFQRDFVWDPNMTMELICSIAENFPAGSLLRIRNTKNIFAPREFAGAPSIGGRNPTYLVLDGQQRLTSLYQAFYGVGDSRYYIELKKLLAGEDFEDCIFYLRVNHRKVARYETIETQAKELMLPLSVLKGGNGGYSKWVREISRKQPDIEARAELEDKLDHVESWFQAIDDYRFPVVTLSDNTSPEAVCTIFETLNRTGVKLSSFELLTARFWYQDLKLRDLWVKAIEDFPIIADFDVDPYYLLQVIALLARDKPSCKKSDVMNLDVESFQKWWEPAVDGVQKGLTFLQDECGVLAPSLSPYSTLVVPLGAIFARLSDLKGPKIGGASDKISRWFWCTVFLQKYDSGVNTLSAQDFNQVLAWIGGGGLPDTVMEFRFDPAILRDTTARQRAIYRGSLALILRNHSRDFHTHQILTLKVMTEGHVDDHHIFPSGYLAETKFGAEEYQRLRECVLNHTLIDRTTNIRIKDRAPSDYMAEILAERGDDKFAELLNTHLLPTDKDKYLLADDFEGFLEWRQKRIWQEIKQVTGFTGEEKEG